MGAADNGGSMNHRSKALTNSARGETCVNCGWSGEGVVWAHSNEGAHGKGLSIKAHDLLGNYLCGPCHAQYDRSGMSWDDKRTMFRECYPKTMTRVAEKIAAGELKL